MALGGDVVWQPIQKCVAHQLGEEKAHRKLDHARYPKSPKETNGVLFFVDCRYYWRYCSILFRFAVYKEEKNFKKIFKHILKDIKFTMINTIKLKNASRRF
jgi:hypothetical protein